MDAVFKSGLRTTDWNEEWKLLQAARQHADDAAVWDARAKTFSVKHGSQSGYVARFLELADVKPGETVLDMGCGTGSLATPLAQAGHAVIACDFSRGMMDVMVADQAELGVTGVKAHIMSWADNWDDHGVGENCADVAIASRSIATADLREALFKLSRAARRRVCITLPASASPKSDDALLRAAGLGSAIGLDFLYAFNILGQMGAKPEVAYIPNTRMELFESFDDALGTFTGIARAAGAGIASPAQMDAVPDRLGEWLETNLVQGEEGWHLREPRDVTWAFLAWEPTGVAR